MSALKKVGRSADVHATFSQKKGRTVDGEEMVDEDVVSEREEEHFGQAEAAWPH